MLLNFHENFFFPCLLEAASPLSSSNPNAVALTCDAIGSVFESNVDFMKMYFEYVNNFDEAVRIVDKWQIKEDSRGARFLKARIVDERHGQISLLGYLLLPIQRVPRYKLLLADLVSRTPASIRLKAGFDKIEGLAREINDRKAEMEGRKRLVELERTVVSPPNSFSVDDGTRLTGIDRTTFVDPARRLVKEDIIHVGVRRKKVAGGLTWEKVLDQKCLVVSCSDKLFLVSFFGYSSGLIISVLLARKALVLRLINYRY
jgi:RhoGEF domain